MGIKGIKPLAEQLKASYEPSKCVFYSDLNETIDLGEPQQDSVWHFTEVCLSGNESSIFIAKFLKKILYFCDSLKPKASTDYVPIEHM